MSRHLFDAIVVKSFLRYLFLSRSLSLSIRCIPFQDKQIYRTTHSLFVAHSVPPPPASKYCESAPVQLSSNIYTSPGRQAPLWRQKMLQMPFDTFCAGSGSGETTRSPGSLVHTLHIGFIWWGCHFLVVVVVVVISLFPPRHRLPAHTQIHSDSVI